MADRQGKEKRYYFYRNQLFALGIGFAITSLIIFVLGIMTGKQLERGAAVERASSAAKIPVSPAQSEPVAEAPNSETLSGGQPFAPDEAIGADTEAAKESKAQEKIAQAETAKTQPPKSPATAASQPSATKSADEKPPAVPRQEPRQETETAEKDSAERVWAVQIKSSPDKKYADNWVNRLKTKGYDAFVAEGDVKGQTWYRVRVGHFAARHEAEELLAALETQEGLSGGFLTMTSATDTVRKPTSQVSKKE
jgi:cell division septation protein DedD